MPKISIPKKRAAIGIRKLLYYWPAKSRFFVSNELRQRLLLEQKTPDGRIRTTWSAYTKIPSTCVLIGRYD